MGRLAEALIGRLDGCILRLGTPVEAIRRPGTRFAVDTGSDVLDADAVIVAAPAHAAAQMLPAAPDTAAALGLIKYASVAVVTLSVRPDAIEAPSEAGFLVTRDTGWLTTACSYGSAKWPHWSGGDRSDSADTGSVHAVLRVSVGRDDDDRHTRLGDRELLGTVVEELSSLPPLRGLREPGAVTAWRVSRWPQSLPQYRPGHGHLVDRISEVLAREMPGVFVAGAAYRGLGIPACIRQGNEAAAAVRAAPRLGSRHAVAVNRPVRSRRLLRDGLALVLGALTMLSLPPWGLWPLGPIGLGLWLRSAIAAQSAGATVSKSALHSGWARTCSGCSG